MLLKELYLNAYRGIHGSWIIAQGVCIYYMDDNLPYRKGLYKKILGKISISANTHFNGI